jgi:hypothetical protein
MSGHLILVEWVDSAQPVPGWHFLNDAPDLEVVKCVSVGWKVGETDNMIMLAPNIGDKESESAQGSGFIRIPKSCITRIAQLIESKMGI